MKNPWEEIPLSDYENHMKLSSVMQLQALDEIMKGQFAAYLDAVTRRYADLDGVLECICVDLTEDTQTLPKADMIIVNLLVEYIGYTCFQKVVQHVQPKYVSCIIQINTEDSWVSDSPYLHAFDGLEQVHHQMEEHALERVMRALDFRVIKTLEHMLPNGKKLV